MSMTKADLEAWQARWRLVNDAEIAELRSTPPIVKLRQLAALMASIDQLGCREALEDKEGVAAVRARWQKLREAYGIRS